MTNSHQRKLNGMIGLLSKFGRYRFMGSLLKFVGVVFAIVGVSLMRVALDGPNFIVLLGLFGGLFLFLSALSFHYGKKLGALAVQEAVTRDTRPPVLYLRPFGDDEITSEVVDDPLTSQLIFFGKRQFAKTEEEVLAQALRKIGPCIAIGQPGEKSPKLGFARIYPADEGRDWQSTVRDLMKRAGVVVIRVGYSDGILLEMEAAVKCVKPECLLFLLPFEPDEGQSNLLGLGQSSPDGYERFRQRLEKHIPYRLPPFKPRRWPASSRMPQCSFAGILFFESDWTPHVIPVDSTSIHLSEKTPLKKSLKPFLARFKKNYH